MHAMHEKGYVAVVALISMHCSLFTLFNIHLIHCIFTLISYYFVECIKVSKSRLVMQHFGVVYYGIIPMSWYTHKPLGECVYTKKIKGQVGDIPWYIYYKKVLQNYFIPRYRKYPYSISLGI